MRSRWIAFLPIMVVVFTAACTVADIGYSAGGYEMIIPDQRIPLSESGNAAGKWEGRDLSVKYRYSMEGGSLALTGIITFADSIRYNYDRMPSFQAGIIFGDSAGRVLGSRGLTTARQSGMDRWDDVQFSQRIVLPPGAANFAFSYTGEVVEAGGGGRFGGGGGGNLTRIWNYPVTKAASHQVK